MSKPLPDHQAPVAATVAQVTAAATASPASKAAAAAAVNLGQELNNEVAAMINTPPSPAVRRSVVQLDTVAPQLSMRPPSFAFVASAETPRRPSQSSSAAPAADDEFSSEYSNHSERDPTEAFETDVEFKMCERPPNEPAASEAVDDNDDQDENCDTENFEKIPPAAGPVWIIPPESDKPKKKKNKKKKRVEKDT